MRTARGPHAPGRPLVRLAAAFVLASLIPLGVHAKTNVVTTVENISPAAGTMSLVQALSNLQDGDTVQFNIPGAGVHYLDTPPNGYPLITANNITIDGYSQPGSQPNSNPIHAPNNAVLNIALTSTNGNGLSMEGAVEAYVGHTYNNLGFGYNELAILGFFRGNNATVRGLALISAPLVTGNGPIGTSVTGDAKALCFCPDYLGNGGQCTNWHVSGCWFGIDPGPRQVAIMTDGQTVAIPAICVAAYRTRDDSGNNAAYATPGCIGVSSNSPNPRAEFNVIITGYGFDSEGLGFRISGNFWNVLPDGMTNLDPSMANGGAQEGDGYIEIGRVADNVLIGTDGDGVNDADEGNVFGGVGDPGWSVVNFWSDHATNVVVAGNWFGLAVDGVTTFTNTCVFLYNPPASAQIQFGSDFDGVSDALEANHLYSNNPFDYIYNNLLASGGTPPTPLIGKPNSPLNVGVRLSFRGNVTVNNGLLPFSYADNAGDRLSNFTNYESGFMDISGIVIPALDATNSIYPNLVGTCAPGAGIYTNVSIDVYQLDMQGWNNGLLFSLSELTDYFSYTNGFPQGAKFLGSFPVANSGAFSLNLSGLDLGPGRVVVTANYSADRAGTHKGRTHTSNFSNPVAPVPAGAATVNLTTVVPDGIIWYNNVNPPAGQLGQVVVGPVTPADELEDNGNWEPYTSVLGDSTFLISVTTYADSQTVPAGDAITFTTLNGQGVGPYAQRDIVVLQPARGGTPVVGEHLYTDAGAPYRGVMNLSRNNGNPNRVAADKRYGAVNFITEQESSIGQIQGFNTDGRWNNNAIVTTKPDDRYVTEQVFSLNPSPASLAQTPLTKAWDFVYGPTHPAALGAANGANQVSRTGGRSEFLDNGNIVVMIDDKTSLVSTLGECTTFSIITPTGTVIKGPTLVGPASSGADIWDNMAAFAGGFAIRLHNMLFFYDDNGNLTSSTDINVSSGLDFGTGREDASRIASDVRSHYVYLGGQSPEVSQGPVPVYAGIWDARTGNFVTSVLVQDFDPSLAKTDRVSVGVDGLDRFCVAYCIQPTPAFPKRQIAARVMAFDGTNVTYLTPPFFPFLNHISTPPASSSTEIETYDPNVSMTPRQILIAGKGSLNSHNNPAAGQDTNPTPGNSGETKVYTVLSHPLPVPPAQPLLEVTEVAGGVTLTWGPVQDGLFTVEWASALDPSVWAPVIPAPTINQVGNNYQTTIAQSGAARFFRLARW